MSDEELEVMSVFDQVMANSQGRDAWKDVAEAEAAERPARTLSDLADQLERGVTIDWPLEQLLMATLVTYYKADNAGVRAAWGDALAFINTIAKERNKLRAENERLRAEDASWEEREAACCPEDVGFEDMIRYLRADVARLRDALKAITSEDGAYMACSDLPWCQASGSGRGSHHAENCAVGIALAALTSVKEAPSV